MIIKSEPYTYIIKFKPTGQYYYGARYAETCNPNELWKVYFTSNRKVKNLIIQYGPEAFQVRIHKRFVDKASCISYEGKIISKILKTDRRKRYLNGNL